MEDSGIRIAAYWAGYTGRIVWNSYDGPVTAGWFPGICAGSAWMI